MPTILLEQIIEILTGLKDYIISTAEKLGLIETEVESIDDNVDSIATTVDDISDSVISVPNIDTNLGYIVSPIISTAGKVDTINTNVATMKNNSNVIKNDLTTITEKTSAAAEFTEDTATNTLNIYNKIVTMASDTTQMRADNQVIIDLLRDIYAKL